jgi:proteasome lid subunit RPN8/RPN11
MAKSKSSRTRRRASAGDGPPAVTVHSSVLQHIRSHARSTLDAEICGVLMGRHESGRTVVVGAIKGREADQGDAHVTFTQETWNTIHSERERRFPDESIVGWYHSHPGFGVFLSDHDLFIHKNFFSEPGQLAWVFDPHTDEEGCFGWEDGGVRTIRRLEVVADDDSEPAGGSEPTPAERRALRTAPPNDDDRFSWGELGHDLWMMAAGALIGVVLTFFLVPLLFRPVVISPRSQSQPRPRAIVIQPGQTTPRRAVTPTRAEPKAPSQAAPRQAPPENAPN